MLCFSAVMAEGIDTPLDFILSAGDSAAIITSRTIENEAIIRVVLGFQPATSGVFTCNEQQPVLLKENELIAFRRKIGVLYHDGGFISNLNLWENLTLQISFEGVLGRGEMEHLGLAALAKVGYEGSPTALLSRLSLFQRRQVAFARALLVKPELMVYQSTFEGLSRSEKNHLTTLARDYHGEGGRAALFLTSNPESLQGMDFDLTYHTGGTSKP